MSRKEYDKMHGLFQGPNPEFSSTKIRLTRKNPGTGRHRQEDET
jgi:hypothetical protein